MPTASDLRNDVQALVTLARRDVDSFWTRLSDADDARAVLQAVMPTLVATYQSAAGTVAADWYDDAREQARQPGLYVPFVPEPDEAGAAELARWAIGPLFAPEPDWATARSKLDGGMQRRIANVARQTVTTSAVDDPRSRGWQRVRLGDTCGFCIMLESRGAVYTEQTVDFAAHDNCDCQAVPAWDGQPKQVRPYTPSVRSVSDADRARTRRWVADHNAG